MFWAYFAVIVNERMRFQNFYIAVTTFNIDNSYLKPFSKMYSVPNRLNQKSPLIFFKLKTFWNSLANITTNDGPPALNNHNRDHVSIVLYIQRRNNTERFTISKKKKK